MGKDEETQNTFTGNFKLNELEYEEVSKDKKKRLKTSFFF